MFTKTLVKISVCYLRIVSMSIKEKITFSMGIVSFPGRIVFDTCMAGVVSLPVVVIVIIVIVVAVFFAFTHLPSPRLLTRTVWCARVFSSNRKLQTYSLLRSWRRNISIDATVTFRADKKRLSVHQPCNILYVHTGVFHKLQPFNYE